METKRDLEIQLAFIQAPYNKLKEFAESQDMAELGNMDQALIYSQLGAYYEVMRVLEQRIGRIK